MNAINLTAIVNALLESPLQESSDDMFLSSFTYANIYVIGEDGDITDAKATVKWRADYDYRPWGIKSIEPVVESIEGYVSVERADGESSTITLDGWSIDGRIEDSERQGCSLFPIGIEINLRSRTVLVKF